MSMLNNLCVACHAWGFDDFCPPVSTLGKRKQPWNFEKKGGQGRPGLIHKSWPIYRISTYYTIPAPSNVPICHQYANPKGCWIDTLKEGFLLRHRKEYICTESRHISTSHEFDFFLGSFWGIPALNHHHLVWPKPRFGPLLLAPIYHFMVYLWVQQIPWGFLPNTEEIFVFVLFWGHLTHL